MEAGCSLLSGEDGGDVGSVFGGGFLTWRGFAVGVVERGKMLDPRESGGGGFGDWAWRRPGPSCEWIYTGCGKNFDEDRGVSLTEFLAGV